MSEFHQINTAAIVRIGFITVSDGSMRYMLMALK